MGTSRTTSGHLPRIQCIEHSRFDSHTSSSVHCSFCDGLTLIATRPRLRSADPTVPRTSQQPCLRIRPSKELGARPRARRPGADARQNTHHHCPARFRRRRIDQQALPQRQRASEFPVPKPQLPLGHSMPARHPHLKSFEVVGLAGADRVASELRPRDSPNLSHSSTCDRSSAACRAIWAVSPTCICSSQAGTARTTWAYCLT